MIVQVEARGLAEFRKAAKAIDRELGKDFRQAWLKAARLGADRAQAGAPASARASIKGRATQRAAFIRITPKRGDELARFLGQKRRSGWYSRGRYSESSGRQFRPWVGNQWDPGARNAVPYFIGEPINDAVPEVVDLVADEVEALADRLGL